MKCCSVSTNERAVLWITSVDYINNFLLVVTAASVAYVLPGFVVNVHCVTVLSVMLLCCFGQINDDDDDDDDDDDVSLD